MLPSKETILIAEDEAITALDIQQSLRRRGFQVSGIACSGPEVIESARMHPPDLVVMDIRLQGAMDGIEAACRIHRQFDTPVVFLTAYADPATLQRAKAADPFAYLLKPFDDVVLSTTIEIALNKHRAHERLLQEIAEALDLSQQRFERLAQSISDHAILALNPAGLICSWNPGAENLYGWNAAEALSQPCSMLYPPEQITRAKPARDLESALNAGRLVEFTEQMRKDGSQFSSQTLLLALRNSSGGVAGFLRVTRAVSSASMRCPGAGLPTGWAP